jgi:cytochrome c biogenesis protein
MGPRSEPNSEMTLWKGLRSVRLTLVLFLILASAAILGTLIPQNLSPEEYLRIYGAVAATLLRILGLTDLYHSAWFTGLMGVLVLNLIACSVHRFPRTWKAVRTPQRPLTDGLWRSLPIRRILQGGGGVEETSRAFSAELSRRGWAFREERREGDIHLLAQKGRYGRLGVFVTHLGVVVVLSGGLVGSLFGFNGFVKLHEGEGVAVAQDQRAGAGRELGFEVRCDAFRVAHYPDGTPREFRSDLSFLEGGKVLFQGPVRVNHPVEYKGFVFYQSSYGSTVRVTLEAANSSGAGTRLVQTEVGQTVPLAPGLGIQAARYEADAGGRGPAILLAVARPGQHPVLGWLLKNEPSQPFDGWTLTFLEASERPWTGLQVKRDPGVWVVWVGSGLVLLGCTMAFFMPHRAMWIRLRKTGEGTVCHVAASAPKGRPALEKTVEGFCLSLAQKARMHIGEGVQDDG